MRGMFYNIFLHNLPLKIISFLLALILFVVVHAEKQIVVQGTIPLTVNVPPGKMLAEKPPRLLRLAIVGPTSKVKQFRFADVPGVFIDLSDVSEGYFKFSEELINLPEGLKVTAIKPGGFMLRYEHMINKKMTIRAKVQGRPAPGYKLTNVIAKPSTIIVGGPASVIQGVNEISTEPVNIDRLATSITRRVALGGDSLRLRMLVAQEEVEVTAQIKPIPQGTEMVISGVRAIYEEPARAATLGMPEQVAVVCAGPPALVESIKATSLVVYYRQSTSENGEVQLLPKVSGLPLGVEVVTIDPSVLDWPLVQEKPRPGAKKTED